MIRKRVVFFVSAFLLSAIVPSAMKLSAEPIQAWGQRDGWDAPPREFNDVQRLGFHDGIEGARRDFGNHRNPDVRNRDEYRSPHVAYELRDAYRDAFRRGYELAARRLWNMGPGRPVVTPPQPPPPPTGPSWDWGARGLRSDAERRGYREGVEEARQDYQYHRRADPDDHDEYRNPRVPPGLVDDYRQGFMRGYEVAMSQLSGEGSWQGGDPNRFAQRFSEIQRRGFHDGMDGARKDYGNHRRPNPANRDEYRTPDLPPQLWHEYREGFRRGYEMAAMRLWGGE